MASDFGDESGEKLFDWILRVGQDAGQKAMLDTADKLASAFRNAREGLDSSISEGVDAPNEWAKLNMKDFSELPNYNSLKEIISEKLSERGITHTFDAHDGQDFLVFQVKDVHEISEVFHNLEDSTKDAVNRAQEALNKSLDKNKDKNQERDAEPLEQRASAAREASKSLDAARSTEREIELSPALGK